MSLDKNYLDVPGTTIFDADESRKGYHLNQFCMSLMTHENRERFKTDQRTYVDEWPMTEDQKQAVLARALARHPATQPLDGPLLQKTQQLGLQREGQIPDLVEHQGSPIGHLNLAKCHFAGARESAFFEPEQLAFQ